MPQHQVQWERMFPDELEAAFQTCPIVYLPYGLCEPHGWHNAVGMDAIRAHQCSCQAAQTTEELSPLHSTGIVTTQMDIAPGHTRELARFAPG